MSTIFSIQLGDKIFKAKRVNVATLKKHQDFLKQTATVKAGEVTADMGFEGITHMAAIVHACVVRAQPEVTLEQIEDEADQETIASAFQAVMTGSGFVAEEGKPGESQPASS